MAQTGQSYGKTLPDQVDRIADVFDAHLNLIADVRDLYRERVNLDREYALKLQALARKASEKKAKLTAPLVLGNEPTKIWDENALRKSTLDNAYAQIIASMTLAAQDHVTLADALTSQVTEVLRVIGSKSEETKRKQMVYYQKLLSDRDRTYSERTKTKGKYDEECIEVEAYRSKQSHSSDKHADRAAKQFEQQEIDMQNSKNLYLLSIAAANAAKVKFYGEDLPALEDSFQDLQTRLTARFVQVMLHAQQMQLQHQDGLKSRISGVQAAARDVNTVQDQDLFVDHNIRPFTAPPDLAFEPCSSHYDVGEISLDPAPKVFLQNKLTKCRSQLQSIQASAAAQRQDVDRNARPVSSYRADRSVGDIDEISDTYLESKQKLAFYLSTECNLKAEIDVISAALAGDEGAQMPHSFKSSSFSIPTQCGYCKSSIWGLSKQGKTCKTCGLCVHAKCELKVPAECGGSAGSHNLKATASVSRTATRGSAASSVSSTPTVSSFGQQAAQEVHPAARVVFSFTPTSPFELEVSEGALVHVLEDDDGSGWVKVADDHGGKGLVPASYIETTNAGDDARPAAQSQSLKPQKTYVRGVYAYQAQGSDELAVSEGEMIELTDGPTGGQNYADGWWEGISTRGKKGIFPSNYVELA
ncbi:hypothetical protein FIBSPDRAFT_810692 [Athelia psychrophila]|uniref:FCH-domain-containing protein n=1 Tax=Athelia psychrophila TaxID=1759441 RepID=A0A166W6A0_9AGAM|nr:hypothetical protein FIBSPDRAFT_810692 [Fibularhizoctonia sp. CBS 109695]